MRCDQEVNRTKWGDAMVTQPLCYYGEGRDLLHFSSVPDERASRERDGSW